MARRGFEINLSSKRKINKLARLVGCPLNWKRKPGVSWNGKDVACIGLDASDIIHEIAHYAVATKAARKEYDYGLGYGPSTEANNETYSLIKEIYSPKKTQSIEERASALGIYWEKKLGFPWESTVSFHSWENNRGPTLRTVWKNLSRVIKKFSLENQ